VPAATITAEDEGYMIQPKSKAGSRKASKTASKAASKVGSKAVTPKGAQTPKPAESAVDAWSTGTFEEVPAAEGAKPPSAAQSPLATVPEDPAPEVFASQINPTFEAPYEGEPDPPGGLFVTNPDETAAPPAPIQGESGSFPGLGSTLSSGVGGALFGALGWGKKDNKSKPTTPTSSTPGGFGGFATSVAGSTGNGGWGAATGNDSRSNSAWLGMDELSKSVNGSSADLLDGGLADSSSAHPPVESGGSQLPSATGEVLPTETQGEEVTQEEESHPKEPLTVNTDVEVVADAATAGPTTAGDSPEGGGGGGDGEGDGDGGEDAAEKVLDEEWGGFGPGKTKKKKGSNTNTNAGTPVTPSGGGGGEEWSSAPTTKKKKNKKK